MYDADRDPGSDYVDVLKKIAAGSGGQFFLYREELAR
jgi:hypothetical protein